MTLPLPTARPPGERPLLSRLMRQGWAGVVTRAFGMAGGFVGAWLMVRLLGGRDFGVYSTVLAVVTVIGALVGFGLRNTLVRVVTRVRRDAPDQVPRLMRTGLALTTALWLLAAAALTLLREELRALFEAPPVFSAALLAMLPLALLWAWRSVLDAYLIATGRLTLTFFVEYVVRSVATLLLLAGLLAAVAAGAAAEPLVMLALGMVGLDLLIVGLMLWRFLPRTHGTPPPRHAPGPWRARTLFAASSPVALRRVVDALLSMIDRLMLAALTGQMVAVGVFSIARKLSEMATIPNMMLGHSFESLAAALWIEERRTELATLYRMAAFLGFAAAAGIALALALWAPLLLPLFGAAFEDGYVPMLILLFGPLSHIAMGPAAVALVMSGHTRILPLASGLALTTHVVANLALIPSHGMLGAAYASLLAGLLQNGVLAWEAWRVLGVHAVSPPLLAFAGLFASVGGAGMALSLLVPDVWGPLLGSALIGGWLALHLRWFARRHDVRLRSLLRLRGLVARDRGDRR